jgi:hypothetical protein
MAGAADKVTYDDHVFPIFSQACLNCHNPEKERGGLDLSTFTSAMKGSSAGKIAEPGDPDSARLVAVVSHTVEPIMPPKGGKISDADIAVLKAWVAGGLLENKSSSARKSSKPAFDTSVRTPPGAKPDGPPPMPADLLLEPVVTTERPGSVRALAASPWAPLIAMTAQRQVLLYHTDTLDLLGVLPFPEGQPESLAFTPDGRFLIAGGGVAGKSGTTVVWEVTSGRRMMTIGREFDSVLAADLRPDLGGVALGGPARRLKLWDVAAMEETHSIKKHTDWLTALDYSADGILLASGDRNGGVYVWEAATGNEFHTLRAHQAAITATVWRADSNLLATASEDGSVRFWEMNGGSEVRKLDAHPPGVLAFAFAGDGRFLTSGRDRKVKLWKPDFNLEKELPQLPANVVALAFSHDAARFFTADELGEVTGWTTTAPAPVGKLPANPPAIATRISQIQDALAADPPPSAAAATDLHTRLAHWQAAALNTTRLTATSELDAATAQHAEQLDSFAAAVRDYAQARSLLATRRSSEARARNAAPADPTVRAETAALTTYLAAATADHAAALESRRQALRALRATVDAEARALAQRRNLLRSLDARYSAMRPPASKSPQP